MTGRIHLYDPFDCELCLIGAPDDTRLTEEVKRIIHFLEHAPEVSLQDVAYTCACSARRMPAVLAVVAASVTDLRDRLVLAHKKLSENAGRIRDRSGTYFFRDHLCPRGRVAFLFPGAVSFYPDMLRDLCLAFEDCRSAFDELEEALQTDDINRLPPDYIFPRRLLSQQHRHLLGAGLPIIHRRPRRQHCALRLFDRMGVIRQPNRFSGNDAARSRRRLRELPLTHHVHARGLSNAESSGRAETPACHAFVDRAPRETLDALMKPIPAGSLFCFTVRASSYQIAPDRKGHRHTSKVGVRTVTVPIDRPVRLGAARCCRPSSSSLRIGYAMHPTSVTLRNRRASTGEATTIKISPSTNGPRQFSLGQSARYAMASVSIELVRQRDHRH